MNVRRVGRRVAHRVVRRVVRRVAQAAVMELSGLVGRLSGTIAGNHSQQRPRDRLEIAQLGVVLRGAQRGDQRFGLG